MYEELQHRVGARYSGWGLNIALAAMAFLYMFHLGHFLLVGKM